MHTPIAGIAHQVKGALTILQQRSTILDTHALQLLRLLLAEAAFVAQELRVFGVVVVGIRVDAVGVLRTAMIPDRATPDPLLDFGRLVSLLGEVLFVEEGCLLLALIEADQRGCVRRADGSHTNITKVILVELIYVVLPRPILLMIQVLARSRRQHWIGHVAVAIISAARCHCERVTLVRPLPQISRSSLRRHGMHADHLVNEVVAIVVAVLLLRKQLLLIQTVSAEGVVDDLNDVVVVVIECVLVLVRIVGGGLHLVVILEKRIMESVR